MRNANKASSSRSKAEEHFELIHVDTAGPYRVEGIGRVRYFQFSLMTCRDMDGFTLTGPKTNFQ